MDFHQAEKGFFLAGWQRNLADSVSGSRSGCKSHQPRPLQLLLWCCQLPPRFLGQFHQKIHLMAKTQSVDTKLRSGCRKGNKVKVHNKISAAYVAEICPHICLDAHIFIGPFLR
jgi:hypothetical protein